VPFRGTVAHFANIALNSLTSYSVSINWGDETQSAGTLVPTDDGGFDVVGSKTFSQPGVFEVVITLMTTFPSLEKLPSRWPFDTSLRISATVSS
jgi:hypothetical protein